MQNPIRGIFRRAGWLAVGMAGVVTLLGAAPITLPEPPPQAAKVLLVTGVDYPGHLWRQTAPVLKKILEQDPRLGVCIVESPEALASPQLAQYDVVLLHFQNWQTNGPSPAARTNLLRFVTGGKGMMMTHFACGAWYNEWPEFVTLAGRVWFGPDGGRQHDPHGKFTVEIADPTHPITRGLQAFETVDELYTCLTGNPPIRVLAHARSKVDQQYYPMAFILEPGRGRVFHTVLGHDAQAYTNQVAVGELLRRGCAWAAGLPAVR
ncbi:MAG: ThuA domain-containing protein [Verrucomicrobiae bacterium]|nr:ThuA domain-containing protein [Verrucomicrobiae bacterium]